MPASLERFGGVARLYGPDALEKLDRAQVCVIGIGGVGSWIVEALARSGAGALTLIDMDDVCITNTNRQVPALEGEYGRPKIDVLAERIGRIHPGCQVTRHHAFLTESTAGELIHAGYDCVVGAVPHSAYASFAGESFTALLKPNGLIADVKGMWRGVAIPDGLRLWRL